MPRTKGSKNRPKTHTTKDYASQIAEKQESIVSLTAEIASITANIDTLKADLKAKKATLRKAEKEVATLEEKKAKADAKAAEEAKKAEAESVLKKLLAEGSEPLNQWHTVPDIWCEMYCRQQRNKAYPGPSPTTSPTPNWNSFSFRTGTKHPVNMLSPTIRTSTANWHGRA